jgi:hypothetical protein
MGYDIVSARTKQEKELGYDNVLSHIQCQYAYQQYFREAFGCEITKWNGRLKKKDIPKIIEGIDNFINLLTKGINIPMYIGNLSNCSQVLLIGKFEELKQLINDGKIGYISIS